MNRRDFLTGAAGAAITAGARAEGPKKAVEFSMLPGGLSLEERFRLARDVGFAGVEVPPVGDPGECERMRAAADKAGLRIHSVIYGGWDPPLTHPDAAARARSLENAKAAIGSAKRMGAETVL